MFLKKMIVYGFKSFADRTEIIVEKGMTAIVGPNGSGKSNISDSIKWVLGEQSPKTLRGSKMEDIIFAGTEKRKPLGYAEVELVFNNEDGNIPIEYKEVSIKRRLFRTGESEYSINKRSCRLKDIKELFLDTGIGKDGYSVIGQGKVEEILSPNSDVRRGVFEEAAGIVKFKVRKEEAIKKLKKTKDNLDRINDIIHELEIRVNPLKDQSEKAIKYIDLNEELKKLELNLYVKDYEKNSEQLEIFNNQKKDILANKNSILDNRQNIENELIKVKDELNIINKELINDKELIDTYNKEYMDKDNLIKVQKEKILLYSENVDSIEKEIKLLKDNEKEIQEKINSYKEKLKELESLSFNKNQEYMDLTDESLKFKIKMETSSAISEEKRNKLFDIHKMLNKLNGDKNSIESIKTSYDERVKQFEKEIKFELNNRKIKQFELEENETNKKIILNEISNLEEKLENNQLFYRELEVEKNDLEHSLKQSKNDLSTIETKLKYLNGAESLYDGYYKSVQKLMNLYKKNNLFAGSILGTVADVIKTDKNFETAIEIALGGSIQNVIVNNNQDAENIIRYLKDNKIGRVTFLPVSSVLSRSLNSSEQKYLSMPGVIDTADNLIKTDSLFLNIVKNLLGRTIIVENIKDGFRISKASKNSLKIVSLQGDVINPGGSVTGGHINNKNNSFLSRKREINESKQKILRLTKKISNLEDDYRVVDRDLKDKNKIIHDVKCSIDDCIKKNLLINNNISLTSEQLNKIDNEIEKYTTNKEYIEEENKKRLDEINMIEVKISDYEIKITKLEAEITNISNANFTDKSKFENIQKQIEEYNNEIQNVKQDIIVIKEKINNSMDEVTKNLSIIKTKQEFLNNTDYEITNANNIIENLTIESNKYKEEIENYKILIDDKQNKFKLKQEYIDNSQTKLNNINKEINEHLDNEYSVNSKIDRLSDKLEDVKSKLWDKYEMNYAMALPYKNDDISYNKINNEVLNVRKKVKNLGNINLDSIEEYKEVKIRFDFLSNQKQDLIDAKEQLSSVIRDHENKMKEQFIKEFEKIRVQFIEVFSDLFNGGKADIYLEDCNDALNSNIEIAAQPPGKKLTKISLLSGGEKALTAIALLFSILKTKPTSFCILDEIEAALDDINVYRFSKYLNEFSKDTQFLCITHRKGTMENADTLYGATMEEKGVTKLVSIKLSEIDI